MSELETEEQLTRAAIADSLREFADDFDGDGEATLALGGRQVSLTPTNPVTFKLEGESDWSPGETDAKQSIEFDLVWSRNVRTAEEARFQPGRASE